MPWVLILILLCSCSRDCLWVQSEAVRHSELASYKVQTPDPRRVCPDIGQRLHLHWCLPSDYSLDDGYFLVLAMRFGSREERVLCYPITKAKGCFTYSLLNDEYFSRCGLQSFKAEVVRDGCVVAEWMHQTWADVIEIAIADEPDWPGRSDEAFEELSQ